MASARRPPAPNVEATLRDAGSTVPPSRERGARARGRSVPLVFGVVSLVLVAGALTFAFRSPPPSTPPLAEVAPAPQDQIEVERVEQSSRFGEGMGAEGAVCAPGDEGCEGAGEQPAGEPGTEPGAVVSTGAAGEYRTCSPGPGGPRQTGDPQAPPCIAEIFRGDNGGATARGVTRDAITIAVPFASTGSSGTPEDERYVRAFAAHVNDRYELWGRALRLESVTTEERATEATEARAFAREVAAVLPFASLDVQTNSSAWFDTLASEGVIALSGYWSHPIVTLQDTTRWGPWFWSAFDDPATGQRALGEVSCAQLVGGTAVHGGLDVVGRTRSFGVLVETVRAERFDPTPLESRLRACAAPFEVYDAGDGDSLDAALRTMQADGVTTVLCACRGLDTDFTLAASRLDYTPEWVLATDRGVTDGETRGLTSNHPREQLDHAFGVTPQLKRVTRGASKARQLHEQYWFHALREADPDLQVSDRLSTERLYGYYAQMLILASGIQEAGPHLTPESFAAALEGLRFPNPWVGEDPFFQPRVGFGAGDHIFNSDYALFWFDTQGVDNSTAHDRVNQNAPGRMCYVGAGTRFTQGSFPSDDRFFDPEAGCR